MLIGKRTDEQLKAILPAWVEMFNKLAVSNERRVRENLHVCFVPLIAAVKKGLAPHLKALFPYWLLHHFDPSREVVRAAKQSLEAAFPSDQKRRDLFSFCSTDLVTFFTALFQHTPHTLSDMRIDTEQDAIERYERVMSSGLSSLAHFVDIIGSLNGPAAQAAALPTKLATIFTPQLWSVCSSRTAINCANLQAFAH